MLSETLNYLSDEMATALSIVVTKGFPVWGRPPLVPPAMGIEVYEIDPGISSRIGQRLARKSPTWRLSLFGRNETELCSLADLLLDWCQAHESTVIATQRVDCRLTAVRRHIPETAALQEQYGMEFFLTITW